MAGYYYGRLVCNVENAKLSQQLSRDKRLDDFNGGFLLAINRTMMKRWHSFNLSPFTVVD